MKKYVFVVLLGLWCSSITIAQNSEVKSLPEFQVKQSEVETMLRFLASDELKGRRTGSEGNNIAASYIAASLQASGFKPVEGHSNFYQTVPYLRLLQF